VAASSSSSGSADPVLMKKRKFQFMNSARLQLSWAMPKFEKTELSSAPETL
jgi:hypothetical protein